MPQFPQSVSNIPQTIPNFGNDEHINNNNNIMKHHNDMVAGNKAGTLLYLLNNKAP